MLVRPHLPGEPDARLHLVHDEEALVLVGASRSQGLQELRAEVVVAALGLDGLDDDGGDVVGVVREGLPDLVERAAARRRATSRSTSGGHGEAQLGVVDRAARGTSGSSRS